MSEKRKCDIAVTIQNMGQFYSVDSGLKELIKRGKSVDMYIPCGRDNNGMEEMFDSTYETLKNTKYHIFREEQDVEYKVLLEPYPMEYYLNFQSEYRVKYTYGALSAKPDLVYFPDNYICYDGVICYGPYEAGYLKAYARTHIIGNMLFEDFKRKKTTEEEKPVLLYLPTYGEGSSLELVIDKIDELKEHYHVITKFHHGTSFLKAEQKRLEDFRRKCDEWYDHNIQLSELLEKADVVLSDNSGAVFEAICVGIPVCIIAKELNEGLDEFYSTQSDLVRKEVIPYSDDAEDIVRIVEEALSQEYIEKQKKIRETYFYHTDKMAEEFADVIEYYLNDKLNIRRKQLHDILNRRYREYKEKYIEYVYKYDKAIADLGKEINLLHESEESLRRQLSYYENGKLYNIVKKIYKIVFKILGRES